MLSEDVMPESTLGEPQAARADRVSRRVLFSCHSIRGMRETNQDAAIVAQLRAQRRTEIVVAIVCDGMGGHQVGDLASLLGVSECFMHLVLGLLENSQQEMLPQIIDSIDEAMHAANEALLQYGKDHPQCDGLGTTLVIAVIYENTAYIGSVGDSRCYSWREGILTQLTHDHSVVQELVDMDLLTPDQAATHPRANEITRALGGKNDLDGIQVLPRDLEPNEVLVLCTDGLWKVGGDLIADTCRALAEQPFTHEPVDAAAAALVEAALARGSDDNVTAALLRVDTSATRHTNEVTPTDKED